MDVVEPVLISLDSIKTGYSGQTRYSEDKCKGFEIMHTINASDRILHTVGVHATNRVQKLKLVL